MKKYVWVVEVEQTVLLDTQFEEKVTKEEALKLFDQGDYLDVIDESVITETAVGVQD